MDQGIEQAGGWPQKAVYPLGESPETNVPSRIAESMAFRVTT